jgi:hypothetical protein
MLKIVYPICCGIDVHKTFVVATIATTDRQNITTYQTKRFSTFTRDLRALAVWLSDHQCVHVCMESTGKYWIPVYNILEPSCRITLAHPKYVKAIRGKKTDKKDSVWIADLHKHGLVPGSFIPPADIREIRDLLRYRSKLVSFVSSEKNRVQNSLTVSNIMLSSVVSDTFGKSSIVHFQIFTSNRNCKIRTAKSETAKLYHVYSTPKGILLQIKLAISLKVSCLTVSPLRKNH